LDSGGDPFPTIEAESPYRAVTSRVRTGSDSWTTSFLV
jgi:hypothetical protein